MAATSSSYPNGPITQVLDSGLNPTNGVTSATFSAGTKTVTVANGIIVSIV